MMKVQPWLWLRNAWETGLTVGEVAGIIGGVLSILSSVIPILAAVVVVGLIQHNKDARDTAATWTTVAVTIQSSLWTTFAGLTSSSPRGVRPSIYIVGTLGLLAAVVHPIASFLTVKPLGEVVKASPRAHDVDFVYVKDGSYFGIGTLNPPEQAVTRTCGWEGYVDCPGSSWDNDQDKDNEGQLVVNSSVPANILEPFLAGTASSTLSSPLDIGFRNWYLRNDSYIDGGAPLPVGLFRALDSVVLASGFRVVEGLIIDADDGGVCFRKHTVPAEYGAPLGAEWQEDLFCVIPETSCTSNNLTLGFRISPNAMDVRMDGYLRDDGGLANLGPEPEPHWEDFEGFTDVGLDPDLARRSYIAAWWNNQLTAQVLDIDPLPDSPGSLYRGNFNGYANRSNPNTLNIANMNGTYLDPLNPITNANNSLIRPFDNYGGPFCSGFRNTDNHNASKVYIRCGNLYGVPTAAGSESPSGNSRTDLGSEWNQKIYTCASSMKAIIKTATFRSNGTSLGGLQVLDLSDKDYTDQQLPLWGIEDTRGYAIQDINPLWGLVGDSYSDTTNLSTRRAESIYLPVANTAATTMTENLDYDATGQIFSVLWNNVYNYAAYSEAAKSGSTPDYSGQDNFAMSLKWRNLSTTAEGSAKILNLIWTDMVASTVYGSKTGFGSSSNQDQTVLGRRTVHRIRHSVTYAQAAYAIPAIIVVLVTVVFVVASVVLLAKSHTSWTKVVHYVHQTSMPRAWTQLCHPDKAHHSHKPSEWLKRAGYVLLDVPSHGAPHVVSAPTHGAYTAASESDPDLEAPVITVEGFKSDDARPQSELLPSMTMTPDTEDRLHNWHRPNSTP